MKAMNKLYIAMGAVSVICGYAIIFYNLLDAGTSPKRRHLDEE